MQFKNPPLELHPPTLPSSIRRRRSHPRWWRWSSLGRTSWRWGLFSCLFPGQRQRSQPPGWCLLARLCHWSASRRCHHLRETETFPLPGQENYTRQIRTASYAWEVGILHGLAVNLSSRNTFFTSLKNFLLLYCPNGISPMGNLGWSPRGKPAATELHYPTYCACWVFECFHNPPNSHMVQCSNKLSYIPTPAVSVVKHRLGKKLNQVLWWLGCILRLYDGMVPNTLYAELVSGKWPAGWSNLCFQGIATFSSLQPLK